ncbi:hypothetical protein QVD17_38306 [Tagetes erecta]|uniref:Uncharacterized protein n=1 Tax=Tagetes erecta TaxID=13708 RepID=A0AAD8NG42_TARER|nr:hypothetical protein QVD17_38306 [Tagetes erecta]
MFASLRFHASSSCIHRCIRPKELVKVGLDNCVIAIDRHFNKPTHVHYVPFQVRRLWTHLILVINLIIGILTPLSTGVNSFFLFIIFFLLELEL